MQVKVPANITREIVRKLSNDATISEGYSNGMQHSPFEAYERGMQRNRWVDRIIREVESEMEEETIWKNN
ncbi:hypothetical protein FGO68_gene11552 [Halteria grandinella]|uniref:Uncharacterized protein n=1 Tax=Halteria grandinella TaxID=5974 RepID=A0A8J8P706_HALGN|nr:hypothetical protein FGO68_gene11552 [Halteria grandinella]